MLFLMSHSTHFIYGYIGVKNMVKKNSDCEKGNWLPPLHGLLFTIRSGQVRSGQVRVFNVHIQSKLL